MSAQSEKKFVGYIDVTPTWREMISSLVLLIERGDAKGRDYAISELLRLADFADRHNAENKSKRIASVTDPKAGA